MNWTELTELMTQQMHSYLKKEKKVEFFFKILCQQTGTQFWKIFNLENTIWDQPYIKVEFWLGICKKEENASLSVEDNNLM